MTIGRLRCPVRHYAWGSRTLIPELLGIEPDDRPWAELWIGAHPLASALLERGGGAVSLHDIIAGDPTWAFGSGAAAESELPFLMKVLAAESSLSLQVHPTRQQALAGFEREELAGIPRDAPHRTYRDANHKPELVCALTSFTALCGFRPSAESAALLRAFDVPSLQPAITALTNDRFGTRAAMEWLLRLPETRAADLVEAVASAARQTDGPHATERAWVVRLADEHPGDVGVILALLLNLVELQPGEAIFLEGGTLHAYLRGMAVEVMANSDNVIRGGLTTKHIDVEELLRITATEPRPVEPLHPHVGPNELVYPSLAEEFLLSCATLEGAAVEHQPAGPELVLCTSGVVKLRADGATLRLGRGESAFVAGSTGVVILEGAGTVYRVSLPGGRHGCGSTVTEQMDPPARPA